ncbi:MAG TPA: VCBS repeat-containing protein [Verrucomicrobiae bacterium]
MHRKRFIALGVAIFATVLGAFWLLKRERALAPPPETEAHQQVRRAVLHNVSGELVNEVLRIEAEEKRVAETVWAKEMLAQECGATVERLWDEINGATELLGRMGKGELHGEHRRTHTEGTERGKLGVLAEFAVGEVQLGRWDGVEVLPQGIQVLKAVGAGTKLMGEEWLSFLSEKIGEGWVLEQIEFRHVRFDLDSANRPEKSGFYFAANLKNSREKLRVSLEGELEVEWGTKSERGEWGVRKVDASRLALKMRNGEALFELVRDDEIVPREQARYIDPLMVYDLNGDGLSEIVLAARNLVYWNRGKFEFATEELCKFPEEFIGTALLADVNGDDSVDFVSAKWEGLFVHFGSRGGKFETKARAAWKATPPLPMPMVLTSGDIDGDGDLDLYLGQYKDPYEGGVTPRPFYDANDGFPGYLLVNDGLGNFRDGTEQRGLGGKRNRRTFSASLVDLDRDKDLDLLVVSDFAGGDVYRNDGKGKFADVTGAVLRERHGFGMSHTFADFNRDGLLDILMIGMTSATMDRLAHGRWARSREPKEREMEIAMTYGNRLWFGQGEGRFEQKSMSDSIARAGWAWGCTTLDFDNDGWTDVYVANGFQSKATVQDSEGDYWLHDRFLESTLGASATDLYFKSAGARGRDRERSFGGHERNRFYWNRGGTNFLEVGYLLGLSFAEDSRNVVADDLDGDGKPDVVLTTGEVWPKARETLKVFRNGSKRDPGEVIGPGSRDYVTGDGFRSQRQPDKKLFEE